MTSGYRTIGAARSDAEVLAEEAMSAGLRVSSIESFAGIHSPGNDMVELFRVWLRTHSKGRIRDKFREIAKLSDNCVPADDAFTEVRGGFRRIKGSAAMNW